MIASLQDHAAHPRHRCDALDMKHIGHAANPLCADMFDVGVVLKDGIVVDARFVGKGCALAVGSASLLCEWLRGKRVSDVKRVVEQIPYLEGQVIGRMREGCVRVSVVALCRAFNLSKIS